MFKSLSILLKKIDQKAYNDLWDNLIIAGNVFQGVEVRALSTGDIFKREEILKRAINNFSNGDLQKYDWDKDDYVSTDPDKYEEYEDFEEMFKDALKAVEKH